MEKENINTCRQSQSRTIEDMYDRNGLIIVRTCEACPEQYDVFLKDKPHIKVGYLRLRHGMFRADFPDCMEETIYEAEPVGDGIFARDERIHYLTEAMKAILEKLNDSEILWVIA